MCDFDSMATEREMSNKEELIIPQGAKRESCNNNSTLRKRNKETIPRASLGLL
jgi:hypothetical protein